MTWHLENQIFNKIVRRLKRICWAQKRKKINQIMRSRLQNKDVTIISSNCNGGVISHDLGLQFCSPTVNLFMKANDFIQFCEHLTYYMQIDRFEVCTDPKTVGNVSYPVAFLDDILLFLVHYDSVEEAEKAWNRRKQRVNWENIVIFTTDRDGMTEDLKDRFEMLPYRKVLFTHLPDDKHPHAFYIRGYEEEKSVGIITDHDSWDGKRPIDQFDYVSFLNGSEV